MAQVYEPRPTIRIRPAHANVNHEHETVNIITSRAADIHNSIKTYLQDTRSVNDPSIKQVLYSGGTAVKGFRTIHIAAYTAPA